MTKPTRKGGFCHSALEQLQLLRSFSPFNLFLARKNFHLPELLVGDADYSNLPGGRQGGFGPFDVHFGILAGGAMTQIDGELKHRKAVGQELLTKIRVLLPLLFCFGRQVKKYKYPHNSIFRETIHYISG